MPRSRKAKSSVKKREKKATVERRVANRRTVVKMNQPYISSRLISLVKLGRPM